VKFPTKFEELLPPAAVSKVLDLLSQPTLTQTVRDTLQKVGLKDANPVGQVQEAWRQAKGWFDSVVEQVLEQNRASPAAINATGELFSTRWSSLPTDTVAVQAFGAAAVNFQDQVQLEQFAAGVAAQVCAAPAALFVCSPSACLSLLANCEAFDGGVVIARTDVLRIPGSTDIRGILAAGRNVVTDIGAVNGASEEEWAACLTANGKTLLLVSPNSLEQEEARAQRAAAIAAAKAQRVRVVEFLFDATQSRALSERLGFPLLSESLGSGADVVVAPLDGLLAGPAGALIAGRADLVESLRSAAQAAGIVMQGAGLAAAAAALGTGADPTRSGSSIAQMLLTNPDNLKERARRLAIQLNNTSRIASAEAVSRESRLGPSPWHRYRQPSHAVAITPRDQAAEDFVRELGSGKLGATIWAKVEDARVILDLRLVDPADDHKLVEALHGAPQPTPAATSAPEPPAHPAGPSEPHSEPAGEEGTDA
jgi:L-seryl-tRNA(Ser) seleniumtransferase